MEIQISQEVVVTVCNSLRASRQSLLHQRLKYDYDSNKVAIIEHQLDEVEEALKVFKELES